MLTPHDALPAPLDGNPDLRGVSVISMDAFATAPSHYIAWMRRTGRDLVVVDAAETLAALGLVDDHSPEMATPAELDANARAVFDRVRLSGTRGALSGAGTDDTWITISAAPDDLITFAVAHSVEFHDSASCAEDARAEGRTVPLSGILREITAENRRRTREAWQAVRTMSARELGDEVHRQVRRAVDELPMVRALAVEVIRSELHRISVRVQEVVSPSFRARHAAELRELAEGTELPPPRRGPSGSGRQIG